MKYIDEYRNKDIVQNLVAEIKNITTDKYSIMEVCGGHTTSLHRFGIPQLLPEKIKLLSGPGCPVCVTSIKYIDMLVAFSRLDNVIIAVFGDLIRVPGTTSSLEKENSNGADIRVVYSSLEALNIAFENQEKNVIFPAIGFETTAPTSAAAVIEASTKNIENFYVYSSHKVMPPAMSAIIDEGVKIDGYICPGHVTAITGTDMYLPIVEKYKLGCVVSGFEPVDMLHSIYMLVKQFNRNKPEVEIQYKRAVRPKGNPKARSIMNEVFEPRDDWWRGLGLLPKSGLKVRDKYQKYDAEKAFDVEVEETREPKGCICGSILKGLKTPMDCKLFGVVCEPVNPVGACMVSGEGTCAAYYKFRMR